MHCRSLIAMTLFAAALAGSLHGDERRLLSTGVSLEPAAPSPVAGSLPLGAALSPEGDRIALLLCGWREQGLQVMDRASGEITQLLPQTAAFAGIAFSPDGKSLWTSGGNDDSVYRYAWRNKRAQLVTRVEVQQKKDAKAAGTSYPAGLAFSPDGTRLFVAENLGDGVVEMDTESNAIVQRVRTGRYPYGVAVDARGTVYVSCWGEQRVDVFRMAKDGWLGHTHSIASPRHPSALLLSHSGGRRSRSSLTTEPNRGSVTHTPTISAR